jgi:D-glycero-alpha-D-manno-heptose-7-phosphate kinase
MHKITVTAPTRADLAGGTLDIWPLYCLIGGGKTINIAIDLNATVEIEVRPASQLRVEMRAGVDNVAFGEAESLPDEGIPASLQFPIFIVKEYLRQRESVPEMHLRISLRSGVPLRSGLGGSSSLCVALVRGMGAIFQDFMQMGWQWDLLTWVRDVEAAFLRTSTGTQDYLAALFGGLNCFTSRTGKIDYSPLPTGVIEEFSARTLLLFSGEMHQSGLTNWELIKRAVDNDARVMRGLTAIKQVAEQLDSELRGHLSWKHVGQYLSEEWKIRRATLDVQTPRLEEILEFLQAQKIYGAKVCGAANGGSILVLVEPDRKELVARTCTEHGIQVLAANPTTQPVTIRHS